MSYGQAEQAEYEGSSTLRWAKRQLRGVIPENDPRYKREVLCMGLVYLDAAEMQMEEWRDWHCIGWRETSFISECMPKSYSWLV